MCISTVRVWTPLGSIPQTRRSSSSRVTVRPRFAAAFDLPRRRGLDRALVGGAALFGIGWGLGGFCPGPAIASLATGAPGVIWFVLAMLAGMRAHHALVRR